MQGRIQREVLSFLKTDKERQINNAVSRKSKGIYFLVILTKNQLTSIISFLSLFSSEDGIQIFTPPPKQNWLRPWRTEKKIIYYLHTNREISVIKLAKIMSNKRFCEEFCEFCYTYFWTLYNMYIVLIFKLAEFFLWVIQHLYIFVHANIIYIFWKSIFFSPC